MIDSPIGKFEPESGRFVLTAPWACMLSDGSILQVDAGYSSDGASIPKLIQTGLSPRYDSRTFPAACAHDALYDAELLDRKQCDIEFYKLLKILGMKDGLAKLYYWAVRTFGWFVWSGHTAWSVEGARKYCRIVKV